MRKSIIGILFMLFSMLMVNNVIAEEMNLYQGEREVRNYITSDIFEKENDKNKNISTFILDNDE